MHAKFPGPDYVPELDEKRLTTQHARIKRVMGSGEWFTLYEIEQRTGDNQASISAQLRHLRKPAFGSFILEKRRRGDRENGLFEYRISNPIGQLKMEL